MKHPDWPAFIAAIIADPDDDTVRLVAADFLEENGEPGRAAFIRVQCEIARLEASGLSKSLEMDDLRKRERAFLGPLSTYPQLWAQEECPELLRWPQSGRTSSPLANLHAEGVERLMWRRGFVEEVTCPASEWLRHGAAVRKRQPVRSVWLTECNSLDRDIWYAGLPALKGLEEVTLEAGFNAMLTGWLAEWLPGTRVGLVQRDDPG
jgi:uncharacterized protein (TIGR02996 family)